MLILKLKDDDVDQKNWISKIIFGKIDSGLGFSVVAK
jgi:hypothetical protein